MRRLFSAGLLIAMTSPAAIAQDLGRTGAYGGVSMATHDGTHEYDNSGVDEYDLEGPAFGAFGGYMWGTGNLVYGAEAAIAFGGVYEVGAIDGESYKEEYEYSRFIDVKGRVGYAGGDFLIYGTVGVSQARFESDIGSPDGVNTTTTGMLYGFGADYFLGDRYFLGAEYLRRDYDFYDPAQDADLKAEIDTFTLRVGLTF